MSEQERYAPEWLALRESADAAARAPELLDPLRARLATVTGPATRPATRTAPAPRPGTATGPAAGATPAGRPVNRTAPAPRSAAGAGPAAGTGPAAGAGPAAGTGPAGRLTTWTAPAGRLVIRDLGCGTGSMGRWLAGRLPGPQHWIMHDTDPELLARAASTMVDTAADGSPVTVATRQLDITRLTADALVDTSLVTASALLDVLTADEVAGLVAACVTAGCPALFTLSVLGRVELDPVDPLDAGIAAAFNEHQRRVAGGRRLLGPDAVTAAAEAFTERGATVHVRPSAWRLGPDQAPLTAEWLRGWVGAACAQRPDLAGPGQAYLRRRLAACAAGELRVVVRHSDLLALPEPATGAAP